MKKKKANRNPKHIKYMSLLNSKRWYGEVRVQQLRAHPLCQMCEEKGIIRSAVDVHHIKPVESVPIEDMERLCYDPSNLISLCIPCHIEIHRRMRSHKGQMLHTMPQEESQQADDLRSWVKQVSGGTQEAHVTRKGIRKTQHGWVTLEEEKDLRKKDLENWSERIRNLGR